MAKNTSIALGDHFELFVEDTIKKGRFRNASEVVRAGLRILEEEERKVELLRKALIEGEESGYIENFDPENFLEQLNLKYAE